MIRKEGKAKKIFEKILNVPKRKKESRKELAIKQRLYYDDTRYNT